MPLRSQVLLSLGLTVLSRLAACGGDEATRPGEQSSPGVGGSSGQAGASGASGASGQATGEPSACTGAQLNSDCCTGNEVCTVEFFGCRGLYRCTASEHSGCGRTLIADAPAAGATCTDEGKVCAFPDAPVDAHETSPLVTACEQGQLTRREFEHSYPTCKQGDGCTGPGACDTGSESYCACVGGAVKCIDYH